MTQTDVHTYYLVTISIMLKDLPSGRFFQFLCKSIREYVKKGESYEMHPTSHSTHRGM